MKSNKCLDCGAVIYIDLQYCRKCLKNNWKNSEEFFKPKHDPNQLPCEYSGFRSVVNAEFIKDEDLFIDTLVETGDFYYDNKFENYCCVLNQPLGLVAGSAIPPNYSSPTYPLDSIIIVDSTNNAHAMAEDYSVITSYINNGRLIPVK